MFKNILSNLRDYREGGVSTTVHAELIWCVFTITATMLAAWWISTHMCLKSDLANLSTFFAGIVQALIYLQVVTLVVLALSYISRWISEYRCVIVNLFPITVYGVIRIITDPEPVDDMYTYGATITVMCIATYKFKELVHYLYALYLAPVLRLEKA